MTQNVAEIRSAAATPRARMASAPPTSIAWGDPHDQQPACVPSVSLPFTSPALTGMRVRIAKEGGLEMLLGNPAGGRGFYIARWATLRAYAAPSLHDILLAERIAGPVLESGPLSPRSVQAASLEVAAEGYAGRRLAEAAKSALAAEERGVRCLRAHLLLELARHLGLPGSDSPLNDPWTAEPCGQAAWLDEAPALVARFLTVAPWRPDELSEALASIAAHAWPLGFGPRSGATRLPRILALMQRVATGGRVSRTFEDALAARRAEAGSLLFHARSRLADPMSLLAAWREDRADLLRSLDQPSWLLDGWDRLCLLPPDSSDTLSLLQLLLQGEDGARAARRLDPEPGERSPAGSPPGPIVPPAALALDLVIRNEEMRLREVQLNDPDDETANG